MPKEAPHGSPPAEAPQWLLNEVATGLQRLMLLALPGAPASETIEGAALAWADAFWCSPKHWQEDLDAPRIALAFRLIASRLERFPTPKLVLDALPKRPKPESIPPLKPCKGPLSAEQQEINRQRLAELKASLGMSGAGSNWDKE